MPENIAFYFVFRLKNYLAATNVYIGYPWGPQPPLDREFCRREAKHTNVGARCRHSLHAQSPFGDSATFELACKPLRGVSRGVDWPYDVARVYFGVAEGGKCMIFRACQLGKIILISAQKRRNVQVQTSELRRSMRRFQTLPRAVKRGVEVAPCGCVAGA